MKPIDPDQVKAQINFFRAAAIQPAPTTTEAPTMTEAQVLTVGRLPDKPLDDMSAEELNAYWRESHRRMDVLHAAHELIEAFICEGSSATAAAPALEYISLTMEECSTRMFLVSSVFEERERESVTAE